MRRLALSALTAAVLWSLGCGGGSGERRAQRGDQARGAGLIAGSIALEGREDVDLTGITVFCAGTNHVAFTDASGSFVFRNMPFGQYTLHARHEGFEQTPLGQVLLTAESREAVLDPVTLPSRGLDAFDLPSPEWGGLAGRAQRAGGVDHSGISVTLQGTSHAALTDSQGRWMLRDVPPGDYVLAFSTEGHAPQSTEVTVRPGRMVDVPVQILAVGRGGNGKAEGDRSITGMVALIGPGGTLLSDYSGVSVVIEGTERRAHPDSEGQFAFAGLAEGIYAVSAQGEGYLPSEPQRVDLTESETAEVTLFLDNEAALVAATTGTIRGRLVIEGGATAEGITVVITGTDRTAITGNDGAFEIEDIPVGAVTLSVRAAGYQPIRREGIEIIGGEVRDVGEIELVPAHPTPTVVLTTPRDGERGILLRPEIPVVIEFSEPMNVRTVREGIDLDPPVPHRILMGPDHPQTNERTLLMLVRGGETGIGFREALEVTVGTAAESIRGMALEEPYRFTFTMGRPGIYRSSPEDGGVYNSDRVPIELFFNAQINPSDLAQKIRIRPEPPQVPYVFHETDPETGWSTLLIQTGFAPDEEYEIEATGRLRTATGGRLGPERSITFSTPPDVMIRDRHGNPVGDGGEYVY